MRFWNSKEVAWLKANYQKLGCKACARQLGRSRDAVKNAAFVHGVSQPRTGQQRLKEMGRTLLANGYSGKDVAKELSLSYDTVKRWARQHKIKLPGKPGHPVDYDRLSRILSLREEGWSVPKIADLFGVWHSSIYRTLRMWKGA